MSVTFSINWLDPIADAASVTFSDNPESPVSIPIDKRAPESWADAINVWYASNVAQPQIDISAVIGQQIAITAES